MPDTVIAGMGHFHPPHRLENSFFDSLEIGSEGPWVEERTGIKARCSVLSADHLRDLRHERLTLQDLRRDNQVMSIADMSEQAWQRLWQNSNTEPDEPDAVICGTSIPDFDIPANACTISERLKWAHPSFDVNSACSSFVVNLHVAKGLISSGQHQSIAIFNPERYSLRINYQDKGSAVLFGDGCAASLITNKTGATGLKVVDTLIESDPSNFETVKIPDGGHFSQKGAAVQKFAIKRTIQSTAKILERNNLTPDNLAYFAGHQANLRMVESAAKKLGISQERHLYNVDQFGNQGASGAPCVLSMNWHRFRPGDYIAIAVVGSGLTWGACLLQKV